MTNLLRIRRAMDRIAGYISHCVNSPFYFGLIIFFSATQLGLHFWPSSAFVYGVRVDYLSPTVSLLDLLALIFVLIKFARSPSSIAHRSLSIISPLLLTNVLFSMNPLASLTWSLRFLLYSMFVLTVPSTIVHRSLIIVIPITMFFQVVLGFTQTLLGHTLQGPFYWLGERAINVGSPNVAKWELFGEMMLRSYGTFSHPNVMAGWLVVAYLIVMLLQHGRKVRFSLDSRIVPLATALTVIGVALTQSRSAALSLFGFIIPFYVLQSIRLRVIYYVILLTTSCYLLAANPFPRSGLSITERLTLQTTSLSIIRSFPFFGTGASASITAYPTTAPALRLLQPDHNSFTLLVSWFGLAGVVFVLSFIVHRSSSIAPFFPLLPLLLLDHYLMTSPQGLFILLLYLRTFR